MAEPSTIARPYAEAAFKLADSQGKLADWSAALGNLAAVAADARVRVGREREHEGFEVAPVAFGTDIKSLRSFGKPLLLGPGSIHDAHTSGEKLRRSKLGVVEVIAQALG